jgi:adenine-specific DNA methylase
MTDLNREKRLIEVSMPLEKISKESRREKNIRKGNISTMHKWWARRPIAASRAAAYASLVPDPENQEDRESHIDFIERLSTWEAATDENLLSQAKSDIVSAFDGDPVRVLDPFSGGGALPLEAKRLGCESHALEFNPVAFLLNKSLMEFSPTREEVNADTDSDTPIVDDRSESSTSVLVEQIENRAEELINEVEREIGDLYPKNVLGYLWSRTVPCQNPNCDLEIPA